jgi:S-adenosylmethionine:tRNA ribosyltransferase-isomerase
MKVTELDYELPEELIATEAPAQRDGGRMMRLQRDTGVLVHDTIRSLTNYIPAGALLVVNDTRVIPARLRAKKQTGGRVELLLLRANDTSAQQWSAFGKASKALRPGELLHIAEDFSVRVEHRDELGVLTVSLLTNDPWKAIERYGEVPLPPYMRRRPTESDRERYQTVFAQHSGAIAAPTAGLHITSAMLDEFAAKGVERVAVTLHVGAGTFAPVQVDDLDVHPMHSEWYDISETTAARITRAHHEGQPVIAVGTTVVRTLESWATTGALRGDTRLLIQPGYVFKYINGLLTNLHLPRSTLLALVMAFAGKALTQRAYEEAVKERYRFFSYGDAMLIL